MTTAPALGRFTPAPDAGNRDGCSLPASPRKPAEVLWGLRQFPHARYVLQHQPFVDECHASTAGRILPARFTLGRTLTVTGQQLVLDRNLQLQEEFVSLQFAAGLLQNREDMRLQRLRGCPPAVHRLCGRLRCSWRSNSTLSGLR